MAKIVRNRLFEDPDESQAKGESLRWDVRDGHPFGVNIMRSEVAVGPKHMTHGSVGSDSAFAYGDYEGRIWPLDGVIAFWEAPTKTLLLHIFNKLIQDPKLEKYNIDPEEIHDFLFDIPNPDQTADNEDAIYTYSEYPDNPKITVKDQNFDVKLKRPQHTISPLNKKKEKTSYGGGSKLTAWDAKNNIRYRQALQTSESEKPKRKLVAESLDEATVGHAPIADTQSYIGQMAKGVGDKIDFISKIDPGCILDFGCADGYILNAIHQKYPKIQGLVGYDLDEEMVNRVKSKYPYIDVTDNWSEALYMATEYDDIALSLMSVIHEVYSYSDNRTVHKFWSQQVFNPKFKYVVIRDMMPSKEYMHEKPSKEDIKNLKKRLWRQRKYRKSFEKEWGKITDNMLNMLHWLLKYDYKSNWGREVKENYLPVSVETIKSKIPASWNIIYEDYYIFPPVADKIRRDYGIELKHPTHMKMIIENKNYAS